MGSQDRSLSIIALIFCVLGIISFFLPWLIVNPSYPLKSTTNDYRLLDVQRLLNLFSGETPAYTIFDLVMALYGVFVGIAIIASLAMFIFLIIQLNTGKKSANEVKKKLILCGIALIIVGLVFFGASIGTYLIGGSIPGQYETENTIEKFIEYYSYGLGMWLVIISGIGISISSILLKSE